MTVSPSLGGQAALFHVGWTAMLEPGLAGVLILLRYLVPTAVAVFWLNIGDKCLLTDYTNKYH